MKISWHWTAYKTFFLWYAIKKAVKERKWIQTFIFCEAFQMHWQKKKSKNGHGRDQSIGLSRLSIKPKNKHKVFYSGEPRTNLDSCTRVTEILELFVNPHIGGGAANNKTLTHLCNAGIVWNQVIDINNTLLKQTTDKPVLLME